MSFFHGVFFSPGVLSAQDTQEFELEPDGSYCFLILFSPWLDFSGSDHGCNDGKTRVCRLVFFGYCLRFPPRKFGGIHTSNDGKLNVHILPAAYGPSREYISYGFTLSVIRPDGLGETLSPRTVWFDLMHMFGLVPCAFIKLDARFSCTWMAPRHIICFHIFLRDFG